jgi:alginate O-acetyltransferase complex protein AlgI
MSVATPVFADAAANPHAAPNPSLRYAGREPFRFIFLLGQLVVLLAVIQRYHVAQFAGEDLGFLGMFSIAVMAFVVHYWLPFGWKEGFWVIASILGAALLLTPLRAAALLAAAAIIYLIVASRISFWRKVTLIAAGMATAMFARAQPTAIAGFLKGHDFTGFLPIFGALFMFRIIVYLHDIRFMKERPPFIEFLSYFFILPNFIFLLFPVVDYKTLRVSYYRRDIHEVAQRGIVWIFRGVLQLLAYRIVFHWQEMIAGTRSVAGVLATMFLTFLLYLRVSGQFHIAVGMLRLFGYDLPETNHKYLLSRSMMDFWRRINIYWKDFMVKIVYFPTYFRLRKKGDARAQLVATAAVFLITWALHSYQAFWLTGGFLFSLPDALFWILLGLFMMANVWWDIRHPRRSTETTVYGRIKHAAAVVATMSLIIVLWSLWSAPSVTAWIHFLTYWHPNP